jgi:hypothetical protein
VVVEVGSGDVHVERQPATVTDDVDLRAGLASVYRAGSGQIPRTCMLSILARDQSMRPAAPSTSSIAWCRAVITPAVTHSANRRCAVRQCTGNEPGSLRHAQPDSSTYVSAGRGLLHVAKMSPPFPCCGTVVLWIMTSAELGNIHCG